MLKGTSCLCLDAVTVVLYNTMKSLSEMEEIPISQVGWLVAWRLEHWSLASELSLSCTRPAADG